MKRECTIQLVRLFLIAIVALGFMPVQAAVITHDISTATLTIPGTSTDDYIITGTTTTNYIQIGSGYQKTITLRNVNISLANATYSPITVLGLNNQSNLSPVTKVNVILEGTNTLYTSGSNRAAFQVDQGAQISISAIDPSDNASGTLKATVAGISQGAGIGAPTISTPAQGSTTLSNGANGVTAGGNVIISSGTITAKGGHGAGIGGGYQHYYNGIIAIYGGIVNDSTTAHAAGIGSGCPRGTGVVTEYAPQSAVIVLPPASITATGGNAANNVPVPELGLAGTASITYIGDPNKPQINVQTEDKEPYANIYADLSETPSVASVFDTLAIPLDLTAVKFGNTGSTGVYTFHAQLDQPVTFFTDASSSKEATQGRPYGPVTTTVAANTTIVLPLLNIGIAFEVTPSIPLQQGYATAQATTNAYRLKVTYTDNIPLTNATFALQAAGLTDFRGLTFYDASGTNTISAPTTLTNGMAFQIQVPIKDGKPLNVYRDVLVLKGNYGGVQTGDIRQVVTQRVVVDDTNANNYIKVTATPPAFSTNNAETAIATLNLNITHGSQTIPYNNMEVQARYLITTEPDYDLAIAAQPINGWSYLNIPPSDGKDTTTVASFAGKPEGTYYIHWYVESSVVYAHSKTVVSPTATYGGFGPYIIDSYSPDVTLRVDGEQDTKYIYDQNPLPVMLEFSEPVKNPEDLTVADFEIWPEEFATLLDIAVVPNSGDATFTATLIPRPELFNRQSFTIRLKEYSITDLAGNDNNSSNTVTVIFENDTKPMVTFMNENMYATLQPTFEAEVLPEDFWFNMNTDLYKEPGGLPFIPGSDLSSLFIITPQDGAPLTEDKYTVTYKKEGDNETAKGIFVFTFEEDLINSVKYTIELAENSLFNKLQNGNDAGQSTFLIVLPDFTGGAAGINANPNIFTGAGGSTTLTIQGEGLKVNAENGILSLRVTCPAIGYNSGPITSGFTANQGMDVVTIHNVAIPANTGTSTLSHTFELFLTFNGDPEISTGKTCVVLVEPDVSHIIKVTNTTALTTDLTYGYSTGQAQLAGSRQNITVTNNGAQILNGLTVTLIGPDGSAFAYTTPAPATGLAPGNTATFYVYLQTGQHAGAYAGDTETKVMVNATQATSGTSVSGSDLLVEQVVNPKNSTNPAGEGNVTGNPSPSTTWSNQPNVNLTASALIAGDLVKEWKYAVSSVNVAPGPMDPAWTTINGGKTTATYTFPAGTNGSRYIFWQMNTNDINGITGQVQNSGVYVYNIDLVAPTVTGIVPERTITNATPFKVTVTFSEPVSMADASKFTATNATAGIPTAVGTPVNGLYTTYEVTLTPNAGLVMGDLIVFSVKADAVKDRANNNNPASESIYNAGITYNNINPFVALTTPDPTVNSNFIVTITFSKAVTGLTESDLMIINGAVSAGSLSGSGTTYTVTINTAVSNSGYIYINVPDNAAVDAANNGNESGGLAVDYRKPADRIAAVLTYAGPTYENGAFDVRVNFSRNITGLTAADFAYNTADFAAPVLTGGGKNYVLTLTPLVNKDATTNVQLPASISARDEYGNELIASNSVSVNYDTRQPLVTSITAEGGITTTHFDPFTVTIVFDEPNLHSFDAGKLLLTHLDYLGLVSGPVTNGATTQVKISVKVAANTPSRSTLTLTAGEGTAWDKANNPNKAGAGAIPLDILFVDNEPPHVINITPSNDWAPVIGDLIFTFDEPINPASNGTVWLEDFGYVEGVWLDNHTLSVSYGRLANDQIYTVYIAGYKDPEGNLMIPAAASFGTQALIFPEIRRPVVIIANDGLVTHPKAGETIYVNGHDDFIFEVSAPQGNVENISVKTGVPIRDKEGIRMIKNKNGSITVAVLQVTESLTITVSLSPTANETIGSDNIWAHDHTLYVQTNQPGTLFVYTMAGALYKQVRIEDHQTAIPLEAGFYTVLFNGTSHIVVIK